jgi:outer membrane protein
MKSFKILLTIIFLFAITISNGQNKIAYINVQKLLTLLPEISTVNTQLAKYEDSLSDYAQSLSDRLDRYQNEMNRQGHDIKLPDSVKQLIKQNILQMTKDISNWQTQAQELYTARSKVLLTPIKGRIQTAIEAVAKKLGYDYVLDVSDDVLIVKPQGADIFSAVADKLKVISTPVKH